MSPLRRIQRSSHLYDKRNQFLCFITNRATINSKSQLLSWSRVVQISVGRTNQRMRGLRCHTCLTLFRNQVDMVLFIYSSMISASGMTCSKRKALSRWPTHTFASSIQKVLRIRTPNAFLIRPLSMHSWLTMKQGPEGQLLPHLIRGLPLSYVPTKRTQLHLSISRNHLPNLQIQTLAFTPALM